MMRDFLFFLYCNLEHYALAVWGLRLRFDPPYPWVFKFLPNYLTEPVFEYRTYGLHALLAATFAWILPGPPLAALILFWFGVSTDRSKYLQSNLSFWRRVLKENGLGHYRSHSRYMQHLLLELERRMKSGEPWENVQQEAMDLQDTVIRRHGPKDAPTGFLTRR